MEKEQEMKSETMETQIMVMDEAAAASHAAYRKVSIYNIDKYHDFLCLLLLILTLEIIEYSYNKYSPVIQDISSIFSKIIIKNLI